MKPIQFNREKFNKRFPFFILIDKNVKVLDYGDSLRKLLPGMEGKEASHLFTLTKPSDFTFGFEEFQKVVNVLAIIALKNKSGTSFRGQFELISDEQILFVGPLVQRH